MNRKTQTERTVPKNREDLIRELKYERLSDGVLRAWVIYCHTRTLLDRRPFMLTPAMLQVYPDYRTSRGPWSEEDIVNFLTTDLDQDETHWPFTRQAIADFFRSGEPFLESQWTGCKSCWSISSGKSLRKAENTEYF